MLYFDRMKIWIMVMNALALRHFASSFIIDGTQLLGNSFMRGSASCANFPPGQRRSLRVQTNQSLELEISTIEDMEDVGAVLSMGTEGGDVLLLDGDLGAGKTCFARGFVRARTGVMDLRVTSPTYLLSNTYPTSDGELL